MYSKTRTEIPPLGSIKSSLSIFAAIKSEIVHLSSLFYKFVDLLVLYHSTSPPIKARSDMALQNCWVFNDVKCNTLHISVSSNTELDEYTKVLLFAHMLFIHVSTTTKRGCSFVCGLPRFIWTSLIIGNNVRLNDGLISALAWKQINNGKVSAWKLQWLSTLSSITPISTFNVCSPSL